MATPESAAFGVRFDLATIEQEMRSEEPYAREAVAFAVGELIGREPIACSPVHAASSTIQRRDVKHDPHLAHLTRRKLAASKAKSLRSGSVRHDFERRHCQWWCCVTCTVEVKSSIGG